MRIVFDLIASIFLLWYSCISFQNYQQMIYLYLASALLWCVFSILQRKVIIQSSVLFHFLLILAFHLRATMGFGFLSDWYLLLGVVLFGIVLFLTLRFPEDQQASSIFLMIALISPFYQSILHSTETAIPGIFFWTLLISRTILTFPKEESWSVPPLALLFLILCGIAIPFSFVPWRSLQFFFIAAACVGALISCSSFKSGIRSALLAGFLTLGLSFIAFSLYRLVPLIRDAGTLVLKERLWLVMNHNDLVPPFLMVSCVLLAFIKEVSSARVRLLLVLTAGCMGILTFLTYSRNGWICFSLLVLLFLLFERGILRKKVFAVTIALLAINLLLFTSPVRTAAEHRLRYPMDDRIFSWRIAMEQIGEHPFFGVGWLNYYAHSSLVEQNTGLKNLFQNQYLLPIQTHSMFLDISETAGIVAGLTFLGMFVTVIRRQTSSTALSAGLIAILVSSMFDSAGFWLTSFPLLWILWGLSGTFHRGFNVASLRPAVGTVLALVAATQLWEDRALQEAVFFHRSGNQNEALRKVRMARLLAPGDIQPLELQKEIALANKDTGRGKEILRELMERKRNFSSYYAQLARIEMFDGNQNEAQKHLNNSKSLDPSNSLKSCRYIESATEKDRLLSFLFLQTLDQQYAAQEILLSLKPDEFASAILQVTAEFAEDYSDWETSIYNLYFNLTNLSQLQHLSSVLEYVLRRSYTISNVTRENFLDCLVETYVKQGRFDKLADLQKLSPLRCELIPALLELNQGNHDAARTGLISATERHSYEEMREFWELYYVRTNDDSGLRKHFEILKWLPTKAAAAGWQRRIAQSYYESGQYHHAAEAYHDLTFYQYDDPNAHWWEARCRWLSQETKLAEKANQRAQELLRSNPVLNHLYNARLQIPVSRGFGAGRTSVPNRFGSGLWQTGIFFHPPARVYLSSDVTIQKIEGRLGIIGNAWGLPTDGFTFSINQTPYTIDPQEVSARDWRHFLWESTNRHQVVLEANSRRDNSYDWAFWSIETAE